MVNFSVHPPTASQHDDRLRLRGYRTADGWKKRGIWVKPCAIVHAWTAAGTGLYHRSQVVLARHELVCE